MSTTYSAIQWNHNKRVYDTVMVGAIACYLITFCGIGKALWPGGNEVLILRALGTCAFILLHFTLCIGPLARLDRRWIPILYNRRHLGVATFILGMSHGVFATIYYHGFGNVNPVVSLLATNTNYNSLVAFPFEMLGVFGLTLLLLMAVTSHDFWQKNLTPSVWKSIHMLVYPAYAALVMHVAFGALQSETHILYFGVLAAGATIVVGLHLTTALIEQKRDTSPSDDAVVRNASTATILEEVWHDVCSVDEIPNNRARVVCIGRGERIAIFRYDGQVSAVTNVCAHQRGPLGEGKIVDGCITCPWHGWNYRPSDGQSPPPFQERIATYQVRIVDRRILVNPRSLPPGTPVTPAALVLKGSTRNG